MSRDRGPIHVNRTFPVVSPLVALLQAAERVGWEGGHEAAERAPGKESGEDGRSGHEELAGRPAGRPAGEGCSAREEGVQGELGSKERGSAFEIVDYRYKDEVDRMRAWSRSTRTCLRRPSARQPPSERVGERVERVDEACSQETVVEDRGGAGARVPGTVREPTPPLWERVGRSWYAEEWETESAETRRAEGRAETESAERRAETESAEGRAETESAEKMDITFLLGREGGAQVDALQDDVQREELEREIKRENKVLLKKVRALQAVVDYARCLS